MLGKLRPRSAYDVMAAIAFFIVLAGGSAYAAATIGSGNIKDNAVLSRHIKNGAVTNADLGSNSVGTGKVINGSLLKQDFKAGQLPRGDPGPQGPGAISIPITHVAAGSGPIRTIDGIEMGYECSGSAVSVDVYGGGSTIYASGDKAEDGVLSSINHSTTNALPATGTGTANLDVIATVNGTWDRIDLGGYNGGGTNGCNVWGLVIPGT